MRQALTHEGALERILRQVVPDVRQLTQQQVQRQATEADQAQPQEPGFGGSKPLEEGTDLDVLEPHPAAATNDTFAAEAYKVKGNGAQGARGKHAAWRLKQQQQSVRVLDAANPSWPSFAGPQVAGCTEAV